MGIRFPFIVPGITALLGGIIYILHLFGFVTSANEVYARFCALGLFFAGFILLGWKKAKHHRFSWDDIYKNNTLITITLTILLGSLLIDKKAVHCIIGVFAGVSFLHFLYTRKFYPPPQFFYFIIAYALLLLVGTMVSNSTGFRYLDKTISFYAIPLAFCFFSLSKKTLLDIGEIFFKASILFLSLCLLYWWFNFLHLNVNFIDWITGKTHYPVEITGWQEQAKIMNSHWRNIHDWREVKHFSASYFVNSWSYNYHPTYISFTLLSGLIAGFYLYYKRTSSSNIIKWDLLLYTGFCFPVIMLMQSRVGFTGLIFVIAATGLYYLKLTFKNKYFAIGLLLYLLLGGAGAYVLKDKIAGFTNDNIRNGIRQVTVSYIQENFWWGSGMRHEQFVLEQQAEKIKEELSGFIYPNNSYHQIVHAHNQFLGDMVQFGIWGLIALAAMLAAIAYYAVKNRSYLLQMLLGITLLLMMIDEPLYGQSYRFLVFLFFFTAINESMKKKLNYFEHVEK